MFSNLSFFEDNAIFIVGEEFDAVDEFVEGRRLDIKGSLDEGDSLNEGVGTLIAERMRSFS